MRRPRCGLTLIEMLVATALTLMMMAAAVQIFGLVGESVTDSRATLEMNERVRAALRRLQMDLDGLTVTMLPPRSPADNDGYFEYVEGPVGVKVLLASAASPGTSIAKDLSGSTAALDTTLIDFDDVIAFTTRSPDRPFVGRLNGAIVESQVAEVVWFVRGGNLYRRVLLVLPSATFAGGTTTANFYSRNDVSARLGPSGTIVPNTLADLGRRENRFGHPTSPAPYDLRNWAYYNVGGTPYPTPLVPTLGETSNTSVSWLGYAPAPASRIVISPPIDFWGDPQPKDGALATVGARLYEDVILSHVIGFDVKAWDSRAPVTGRSGATVGYGNYVDLGSASAYDFNPSVYPNPTFDNRSSLGDMVYDTWSTSYEHDPSVSPPSRISDGFDNDGNGIVDDLSGERATAPPYSLSLRGIQVKIRVFEPDSRQVREVTLVQDFMPK